MHEIFANVFCSCVVLFIGAVALHGLDLDTLAGWIGGAAVLFGLANLVVWAIYWVWT